MVFELEEELMAWVNRPKVNSHTSTQGPPPSIIVPSAPASVADAAVYEKLPLATMSSSSLSPSRDDNFVGNSPIFSSAPPVIRIPRVQGRGSEASEKTQREASDLRSAASCTTHRSSPVGAIALLTRGAIKACSHLAPPHSRRRSSTDGNCVNYIIKIQDQPIVKPEPKIEGNGLDEDDYTRIHRLISSSLSLVASVPNWSECAVNMDDGDVNGVEVTTSRASPSNTARGRQRRRATSPGMNNFLREEDNMSTICRTSIDPGATQITNLPWRDNPINVELHGLYSGPVNDLLQPHGEGVLVLGGNSFLKFYGHWDNGELIIVPGFNQRLLNEDEKKDYDASTRSDKIYSDNKDSPPRTYERNLSTGYVSNHPDMSMSTGTLSSSEDLGRYTSGGTSSRQHPPKQKYALGEVARSPSHMVIHRSEKKATQSASMLKKYDQAFIKRSNGLWTCCVLAEKAPQPKAASHWHTKDEIDEETMLLEESMLFVIDEDGATKIVKKRHYGAYIRRMQ